MSDNVRYVKVEVTAYLEIPADQAGIDNFARWPPLAGALDGFEKGAGTRIFSMALKLMDEDFDPKLLMTSWSTVEAREMLG